MYQFHESARGRIEALDEHLYMIDGRLFYFEDGVLDLLDPSDPETVAGLFDYAKDMNTEGTDLRAICGRDGVCWVNLSPRPGRVTVEGGAVDELPDGSRELAGKALAGKEPVHA
ncbi:hypothetical protein [uncultured Alistipes sp.]|jgi:hypothetical protein|uniref:hypothetical protein n=1 Tax=uncultured Alistipes sp. TaxID=538949 RepID=UPI00272ABC53|nr:hypothetical protein [uncultured Alistipes sp.]